VRLREKGSLPFASVVVPVFNEKETVGRCLSALLDLEYPQDSYEIIVVDNGSTDGTLDRVSEYPVQLIQHPNVKVGAVRNTGAWASKGEILGFVDGDCVVSPDWLLSGMEALMDPVVGAVGGDCMAQANPSWVEKSWVLNTVPRVGQGHLLSGGSILIKMDTFSSLRGFDEDLSAGEDTDLTRRILLKGLQVKFVKSCAVVHLGYPNRLRQFTWRQYWHGSSSLNWKNIQSLDKTLILTLFFLGSLATAFVSLFFDFTLFLVFSALAFLSPLVFSIKRLHRAKWPSRKILGYLQLYTLDLFYLLGRSMGVIRSFMNNVGIGKDKKNYY